MLRSIWDIQSTLDRKDLIHVLSEYQQEANIWAVYTEENRQSAKLSARVEFLRRHLQASA